MLIALDELTFREGAGDVQEAFGGSRVTIRHIDNGDRIVFIELAQGDSITLGHGRVESSVKMDDLYRAPPPDNRYGLNKLTGWQEWLTCNGYNFVLSKKYLFRERAEGTSALYELISEKRIDVDLSGNTTLVSSDGERASFCLVLSREPLFSSPEALTAYLSLYYSELYAHNAACSTWYMPKSLNTKLATSVIPYTPDGYQVSVHHSSKRELLSLYKIHRDRLLYALLYNAVETVIRHQPQSSGMFLTTYTSSWLYSRYKIGAPYIDTRLNETFSNAFEEIRQIIPAFSGVDISYSYAEFLLAQARKQSLYKSARGYFFPDYFQVDGNVLTHTSLNHQLGIASYFLAKYRQSGRQDILDAYNNVIAFVEDTSPNWINPENGDLFYEILPADDGGWNFQSKDYVYVTLNDLLLVLKRHRETFERNLPELEGLVRSKLGYLDSVGLGVFDSYAPPASGEGVVGKAQAKRLLRETGLHVYAEKNYVKEDPFHEYLYRFSVSVSLSALKSALGLRFIGRQQNLVLFGDPVVPHWVYALKVDWSEGGSQTTGYHVEPTFRLSNTQLEVEKMTIYIRDDDSNSSVGTIELTPVATGK